MVFAFLCSLLFVFCCFTEELEILAHMEEMRKKSSGGRLHEPKPAAVTKVAYILDCMCSLYTLLCT